jgi:hypothetical protein
MNKSCLKLIFCNKPHFPSQGEWWAEMGESKKLKLPKTKSPAWGGALAYQP